MIVRDPSETLRKLMSSGKEAFAVPGVFNPAIALLARKLGFRCMYFSGAAFSNSLGLPDLGVTTLTEIANEARSITSLVSDIPLIVDIDTGFGEVVNLTRAIREMEIASVAGVQIEDQVMPKRCGHLSGKEVVKPAEMVKKIIAARRARQRTKLVIVARTDATQVEGLQSAIERAKIYLKAGADMIFPDALETKADFVEFARNVKSPLIANMTEFGKTPYFTLSEFASMGYKCVLFPVTTFRTAIKAAEEVLQEIRRSGSQRKLLKKLMTRNEFYKLSDYYSFEKLDKEISVQADRILAKNKN